jgi:hypothetical protein
VRLWRRVDEEASVERLGQGWSFLELAVPVAHAAVLSGFREYLEWAERRGLKQRMKLPKRLPRWVHDAAGLLNVFFE